MKDGFTLIELAIVLIIIGILMGESLPLINIWANYNKQSITREHIQEIREAMEQYIFLYGRYPCPGPRAEMDADYPFAESCVLRSPDNIKDAQARGVYFIESGGEKAVIEGGVPYTRLNIPESTIFDGWGNLYTYAVTVGLTNSAMDSPGSNSGGIAIVNHNGKSIIYPSGSALWVLISHGRDGSGAYNGQSKTPEPCNTKHADAMNCSHAGNYVVGDVSLAEDDNHDDDMVFYRTWLEFPPSLYPGNCHVDNPMKAGDKEGAQFVQDGTFVKGCFRSSSLVDDSTCQWWICRNGVLVPGVVNVPF